MSTSVEPFAELLPPLSEAGALLATDRCLECGGPYAPAPCAVACPAGVDVPRFVAQLAAGDARGAGATVFAENLLGGTCARVCPVELLCEGACVLSTTGRPPIEIGRLQRFAADAALAGRATARRPAAPNGFRVAVIGAGPAGLVSAGELAALGYSVTVYAERPEPGGLVRFAIAPYRQLRDPIPAEAEAVAALGVRFEYGHAIDSPAALAEVEAASDAVVLAVGMGPDADVSYPGDDLPGVWDSLPFIEAIKTGAAPAVGSSVAVVGGGNTAIDVAREAVRLGAADVTLLYRRTRAEMPAYPHEVDEALDEGVRVEWLTVPVRFVGGPRLLAVECRRMRLGEPDASGRRRPEPVAGTEFLLPVDTVVKAIGQQARAEFLGWVEGLELDRGIVKVDPATGRTTNPTYFSAGDATSGGATVVDAVREAKIAAHGVDALLSGERPR